MPKRKSFRPPAPPRRPFRPVEETPRPSARPDRPSVKPWRYAALSLLFSILLFAFFLVGDRGFLHVRRQRHRLADLQAEVSGLATENEKIDAEVKALKNDPKAVEKIAREELNMVRPDEVVLLLPKGWTEKTAAEHAAETARHAAAAKKPAP